MDCASDAVRPAIGLDVISNTQYATRFIYAARKPDLAGGKETEAVG